MNIYLAGETTIGDTSSDVCSDVFKILRTSVVVAKGSIIVGTTVPYHHTAPLNK